MKIETFYYEIHHTTRFRFSDPVTEHITETRVQPLTDERQRCLSFELQTLPRSQVITYRDHAGNHVHHFDVLRAHKRMEIVALAIVEVQAQPVELILPEDAWAQLRQVGASGSHWDFLHESHYIRFTPIIDAFIAEIEIDPSLDPFALIQSINQFIYDQFDYVPQSTKVDSLPDEAIHHRKGVCQDFAHVMIAVLRRLGIPCRYVSGYLYHHRDIEDRSADDATHAWVEAWLPQMGWVGFDPTNNLPAGERHIRSAVGRDYRDVSPTRGVFKGEAESVLEVSVVVSALETPPIEVLTPSPSEWAAVVDGEMVAIQQMQQQQ